MRVLLVEPAYYTKYPPLGLLKLASYYRSHANDVKLIRGINNKLNFDADKIEITSLFTYAWKPVHDAIEYYHNLIPDAQITVGGIYASIMPDRIKSIYPFVDVHVGLHNEADQYLPSYDILDDSEKWGNWDASIIFSSRGCIRNCPFCIVPKIEGKIRCVIKNITHHIYPGHKKVILWDNNFFASPEWKRILENLLDTGLKVDFNQGLDARLIDEEKAALIADLKMDSIRMAYDHVGERKAAHNAVNLLADQGVRKKDVLFYALYNFYSQDYPYADTPESFLGIIKDISEMGCASYPMRYEPLNSLKKNEFISPNWTSEKLEMIADARRVIGFGGAFPSYKGLVDKFMNAKDFNDAFKLREKVSKMSTDTISHAQDQIMPSIISHQAISGSEINS
jgi:hypothetical protein